MVSISLIKLLKSRWRTLNSSVNVATDIYLDNRCYNAVQKVV